MRTILLTAVISVASWATLFCQPAALSRSPDVTAYRPIGEKRVWTFISRDSTLGRLESVVDAETTVDGIRGVVFKEQLRLDFNKVGHELLLESDGDFSVSAAGHFLREHTTIITNGQTGRIELERSGDKLEGVGSAGDRETEQSLSFRREGSAMDGYCVDQLELFLAMRDIKVGDVIDEEVVVPRDMLTSRIQGEVREFAYVRLYNQVYDSVFLIVLSQPQAAHLYFTRDRRLVKASFPNQDMRAYLDVVRKASAATTTPTVTVVDILSSLPLYLVYLLMGLVAAVFFVGWGYCRPVSYMSLVLGAALWAVVVVTQIPIQNHLLESSIIPAARRGESLLALGLLPALVAGVIQELLKFLAIYGVMRYGHQPTGRLVVVGSLCGAGLGVLEACFLVTGVDLSAVSAWSFLERGALILYHTASGALLAYGLASGGRRIWLVLGSLVAVNSALRYLPVFVQQQLTTVEVICLLTALVALPVFAGALLLWRRLESAGRLT
jgi:RsiW-degrading membrane proteinase PrsW (M82 family)